MDQAALRLIRGLSLTGAVLVCVHLVSAAEFDARTTYDKLDRQRVYPQFSTTTATRVVFTSRVDTVMDSSWTGQHVQVWTHSPLERAPNLLSLPATNAARTQAVERAKGSAP